MRRLWLVGWSTNLIGFGVRRWPCTPGSVALVQPVLVTQLLFAVPMAAARAAPTRRLDRPRPRPSAAVWWSSSPYAGWRRLTADRPGPARLGPPGHGGRRGRDPGRLRAGVRAAATLLAVAAGLCFAVSAAMIKLTTDDLLYRGVAATARDWPGYTLAVATLAGLLLGQGAFAGGSLPSALAAMSITNPVASYAVGVFAFGVAFPHAASDLAALVGAAALISIGAVGLANSPLVLSDADRRGRA